VLMLDLTDHSRRPSGSRGLVEPQPERKEPPINRETQQYHVCDLHCDLLAYLAKNPNGDPGNTEDIGCAIPYLREGRVALQVMAVHTTPGDDSVELSVRQVSLFGQLLRRQPQFFTLATSTGRVKSCLSGRKIGIVLSIEGGSGLCLEDERLDEGLARLDRIVAAAGRVIYISLTHNAENRFGGGNASTAGLKDDGRVLLEYLNRRGIAIDLSHTSDALADGILNHLDARSLDVPVLASHSNFRALRKHPRNLNDELAGEVIRRKGLIGMNFLREFVDPDRPEMLQAHIEYGLELGAGNALCLGADFFHTGDHPDKSRIPFFFPEHQSALSYAPLLADLGKNLDEACIRRLAYENVVSFVERNWAGRGGASLDGSVALRPMNNPVRGLAASPAHAERAGADQDSQGSSEEASSQCP